jgi:hypothetical protein
MSTTTRRWKSLSVPRRLVGELMRASRGIPAVTAERRMNLRDLIEARRHMAPRPAWTAIIAKAFAVVASQTPALRASYISLPWPHLCEHSEPVAGIAVEREFRGEDSVFFLQIRRPNVLSLGALDAQLRHFKEAPVESLPSCQRALSLARLPWPIRGWLMWLAVHASGRWRERHFGTFGLSSPAAAGAGLLNLILPLSCGLHYGLFDEHGDLDVRLTFDHRVLDGATAARALAALESVLNDSILKELISLARTNRAA